MQLSCEHKFSNFITSNIERHYIESHRNNNLLYKIKKTHEMKLIISNQAGLCLSRSPKPPIGMDAAGPGMLGT